NQSSSFILHPSSFPYMFLPHRRTTFPLSGYPHRINLVEGGSDGEIPPFSCKPSEQEQHEVPISCECGWTDSARERETFTPHPSHRHPAADMARPLGQPRHPSPAGFHRGTLRGNLPRDDRHRRLDHAAPRSRDPLLGEARLVVLGHQRE